MVWKSRMLQNNFQNLQLNKRDMHWHVPFILNFPLKNLFLYSKKKKYFSISIRKEKSKYKSYGNQYVIK